MAERMCHNLAVKVYVYADGTELPRCWIHRNQSIQSVKWRPPKDTERCSMMISEKSMDDDFARRFPAEESSRPFQDGSKRNPDWDRPAPIIESIKERGGEFGGGGASGGWDSPSSPDPAPASDPAPSSIDSGGGYNPDN